MYDFESIISRANTGSVKHDMAPEKIKSAGYIPLTIADMEFQMPTPVKASLARAAEHGICGYTYADDAYLDAVLGWMRRRHGYIPARESMCNTAGVVTALGMAVRAFTKEGDGVVIQPPVYPPFRFAVRENGRKLLENPLLLRDGRYEMDFDGFEELCKRERPKLLILCSPHNPVGRVWAAEELARLSELCLCYGVFVVADEIHGDLTLKGKKHTVFATLSNEAGENCMVCTAVSKTFNLAGLCCSNIFIANKERREAFAAVLKREASDVIPYFARAATLAAYTECDAWLDGLLTYVEENFALLGTFLKERLPMLRLIEAEGTYLAWVDMRSLGLGDKALEELMLEKGLLALDEGYIFGTGGSGFERINLALPRRELEKALLRMERAVKEAIS